MRTSTVRRVGLAVAVAAALTSVTSCSGAEKFDPIAALRQVQKKTDGVNSAKVEGTTEMGTLMSMKQTGAVDWSDGLTGTMQITYTGGSMADAMKQSGGSGSMEARYYKDGYAVNMGDGFAQQSGGKRWISYEYADLAKLAGASGEAMKQQMQNATPNQGVQSLLASGDVKKVGEEDVRGVRTTHYAGTLDVAGLTEKNSALDAAQLTELKKQLDEVGITTEQVDIWVDENDLLVKKTERAKMKTGEMNSTVYYSDYGTKVSVEKPSAGDTVKFTELMKQQQNAGAPTG
ncbi:hypothetical protein [Streptomyces sp. CB01580]|uniref:hypothetical protein n=1 Tax=Streptomyces sp. CB01580 TaxID=1703933 RepID=UPI00093F5A84|nr:hypothetical protein [Streptomyces sp. CB01580]OKJ34038.1 hypothetical protein AMK22_18985 [Streptomyces sp. CB01580]